MGSAKRILKHGTFLPYSNRVEIGNKPRITTKTPRHQEKQKPVPMQFLVTLVSLVPWWWIFHFPESPLVPRPREP